MRTSWLQLSVSLPIVFVLFVLIRSCGAGVHLHNVRHHLRQQPDTYTLTEPDRHTEASMVPTLIENVRAALLLVWCYGEQMLLG